jgi:hypothetical protein
VLHCKTKGSADLSFGPVIPEDKRTEVRIDGNKRWPDHSSVMSAITYERERRSSRVFMRIRVVLAGKNQQGRRFRETTETIVVNAHGGLLYLGQELEMGSLLILSNPSTQDEEECRVVYLGDDSEKGRRVGIEFLTPAPRFWGVEFKRADLVPAHSNPFQSN